MKEFESIQDLVSSLIGLYCGNASLFGKDSSGYLCYAHRFPTFSRIYCTNYEKPDDSIIKISEIEYILSFTPTEYGAGKFYIKLEVL